MNKMKIGQKLTLAFGIIISLTIMLGVSAVFFLLSIDTSYSRSYAMSAEPLPVISEAIKESGQLRLKVSRYVNHGEEFTNADYRRLGRDITQSKENLKNILSNQSPGISDEAFGALNRLLDERLFPTITAIINEQKSLAPNQVRMNDLLAESNYIGAELSSKLSRLLDEAVEEGSLRSANLTGLSRGVAMVFAVMSLAIILASLAISWLIVKTFTRPVWELKKAAEEVARGNLSAAIDYESSDEFGDLANSTRRTIASLSDYIGEIKHALIFLGRGDYDYQARDIFKGDFGEVKEAIDTIASLLRQQKAQDDRQKAELLNAYKDANWANKAKSDFLAHMSHDIRTPMNAILGMASIAQNNFDNTAMVQDCLKKISLSGTHLLGLINDVLDMSKIEQGKMSLNDDNASLAEIMENIVSIIQPQVKAKKQNLYIRLYEVSHEALYCDSLRLNQVFINLLSNAVKFTPVGGDISFEIKELPSEQEGRAHYNFIVSDTGIGMKPEFINDIFSAFSRETKVHKTEGSGLGMAICKNIIDLMGGSIEVKSREGEGSSFIVDLHLTLASVGLEEMKFEDLAVLLVDDDQGTCQTAAAALAEMGVRAEWVTSGADAVEKAARAHREGRDYQAIIVDWQMAGLDGVETIERIRAEVGPRVSLILISAYDWAEIEERALKAGANGFIAKPLFKSSMYYGLKKHVFKESQAPKAAKKAKAPTHDFSGRRILLVEDNEMNRMVAKGLLASTSVMMEEAENGEAALDMFSKAAPGYYDLILMDVQMPIMGGYEATRRIRKLNKEGAAEIPIVAMTGNVFDDDIKEALASGMNGHVAKPIMPAQLMKELSKHLGLRA